MVDATGLSTRSIEGGISKNKVAGVLPKVFAFWGAISFEFYCIQEFAWSKFCEITSISDNTRQILCFIAVTVASLVLSYLGKLFVRYTSGKKTKTAE